MTKLYNLTVWYKHEVSFGFMREDYNNISEEVLNKITARYNEGYKNNDYIALEFEYTRVQ